MSVETLKATSSADFLAALPRLTGMHAPESLFIVFFQGKRTYGTARLDLPTEVSLAGFNLGLLQWLQTVAEIAQKGDAPALVIYTDDSLTLEPETSRYGTLAGMTKSVSEGLGFPLRELCVVGADGWAEFMTDEPPRLRNLDEITSSPLYRADAELLNLTDWRDKHPGQTNMLNADTAAHINAAREEHVNV